MIDLDRIVLLVRPGRENVEPVDSEVAGVVVVGFRQSQIDVALRHLLNPTCGDNVVRELPATIVGCRGRRIKDVSPERRIRKIAGQFVGGGNPRLADGPAAKPIVLSSEKEERLVLPVVDLRNDHRSAEGAAKLILPEGGRLRQGRLGDRTAGRKNVVADELPGGSGKRVPARTTSNLDGRSGDAAVLRLVAVRGNAELLNRIQNRLVSAASPHYRGVDAAVEQEGVSVCPLAIDACAVGSRG